MVKRMETSSAFSEVNMGEVLVKKEEDEFFDVFSLNSEKPTIVETKLIKEEVKDNEDIETVWGGTFSEENIKVESDYCRLVKEEVHFDVMEPGSTEVSTESNHVPSADHNKELKDVVNNDYLHGGVITNDADFHPELSRLSETECKVKHSFKTSDTLYSNEIVTCYHCNFTTRTLKKLRRHMFIHLEGILTLNHQHSDRSAGMADVKQQIKTKKRRKIYNRNVCNYSSSSKLNLTSHLSTHTGIRNDRKKGENKKKKYSCDICNYNSSVKYNLIRHMLIHDGKKLHNCKICSFSTNQKSSLNRHMNTHTGEKPFSCDICDYKAAQKTLLNNHLRRHLGIRPYICDICDFKFVEKSSLNKHKRIHIENKMYKCNFCDFVINNKVKFNIHVALHEKGIPFRCKVCNYKGIRRSVIYRHMKTHSGVRPHNCNNCDYSTSQTGNLKRHITRHHANQNTP